MDQLSSKGCVICATIILTGHNTCCITSDTQEMVTHVCLVLPLCYNIGHMFYKATRVVI